MTGAPPTSHRNAEAARLACESAPPTEHMLAEPTRMSQNDELAALITRAQQDESAAVEALLQMFRPLLRSRMQQIWAGLQQQMSGAEWADVESQIHLLFLTRLRKFRIGEGVYFPHYIARMLDFDCRAWMREQRRHSAVPFSQLVPNEGEAGHEDETEWWANATGVCGNAAREAESDAAQEVERALGLRAAMNALTRPQQQVVWDCCVLGRTETDVAQRLGVSRSAVRNRLAAALSRLRAWFHEHEQDQSSDGDSAAEEAMLYGFTRTGRALPPRVLETREFWIGRMNMAKDDKRPDLVGVGAGRPVLLQGIYDFEATGLKTPELLSPKLSYTVPRGCVAGIRFFRVGVSC